MTSNFAAILLTALSIVLFVASAFVYDAGHVAVFIALFAGSLITAVAVAIPLNKA